MTVIDSLLLDEFRRSARCSFCNKPTPDGAQPHHLWRKGMGGGAQLDVRLNLLALCLDCHNAAHAGHRPLFCDQLALVAAREGLLQSEVERAVLRLRRAPKGCSVCPVCAGRGLYWRPCYGSPCWKCLGGGILGASGEPWADGEADADRGGDVPHPDHRGQGDGLPARLRPRRPGRGGPADVEAPEDGRTGVPF